MATARSRASRVGGDALGGKSLGDHAPLAGAGDGDDDASKGSKGLGGLRGDYGSIALLLLLYTLQGVPMGLSASVSFILQEKGASYAEQGIFSLASWPFSLKILWAPVVDSLYLRPVGQRRSWLIPLQMLVGLTLLWTAGHLGELISERGSDVRTLAGIFFWIYALLASQDIAVDGWALTMLSRRNVGLASTCNSVGQTAGFFISFTGFLVLNAYGSVGLGGFISFWGFVFLGSAGFVFLKKERPDDAPGLSVADAYRQAVAIAKLPAVLKLSAILVTRAIAFSAAETLTTLKLLERGVPKQHMATLSACMTPISVFLPVYISRWTGGARPLDCITSTWMFRAFAALGASAVVLCVPENIGDGSIQWGYYAALFLWLSVYAGLNTVHFVSFMAFYSRVSDADMGGTYMTLLNTVSNLGFKWVETSMMFAIDAVSSKQCVGGEVGGVPGGAFAFGARSEMPSCTGDALSEACVRGGGKCVNGDAPFHVAVALTPVIAFLWLSVARRHIDGLQTGGMAKWKVQ